MLHLSSATCWKTYQLTKIRWNKIKNHSKNIENQLLEVTSEVIVFLQVEVSCPSGWTLTDCSFVSRGSAILGPVAKGNSCHVYGVTGVDGAAGAAVCCRVAPPEQQAATPHWSGFTSLWFLTSLKQLWRCHFLSLVSFKPPYTFLRNLNILNIHLKHFCKAVCVCFSFRITPDYAPVHILYVTWQPVSYFCIFLQNGYNKKSFHKHTVWIIV